MSSWSVLCCPGCQALECVHVCVCVTDECKSVSESTRWLKRAMWLPVVSWRAPLWWKVIRVPEERPVRSFLPLLHHRPSTLSPPFTHMHTRTLGILLITIIALTVQWRTEDRAFPCSILVLISSMHPVCVFACMYVYMHCALTDFCWRLKMNTEDDSVSVALSTNSIHTPSAV